MIHAALLKFQSTNISIHKNCTANLGGGRVYKYADLPSVLAAVKPALTDCGLLMIQTIDGESLTTKIVHVASGESIESRLPLETGGLSWHQIGSAISYGRRYALTALLGLAPDDDDDAHATLPAKPASRFDRGNGEPVTALKRAEPPAMSGEYCDTCGDEMTVGPKTGKPYCHRCWAAKREHSRN